MHLTFGGLHMSTGIESGPWLSPRHRTSLPGRIWYATCKSGADTLSYSTPFQAAVL